MKQLTRQTASGSSLGVRHPAPTPSVSVEEDVGDTFLIDPMQTGSGASDLVAEDIAGAPPIASIRQRMRRSVSEFVAEDTGDVPTSTGVIGATPRT